MRGRKQRRANAAGPNPTEGSAALGNRRDADPVIYEELVGIPGVEARKRPEKYGRADR
jgi:hypothetical protein